MKSRYPLEFELNPKEIESGTHWVTLELKNIGSQTLKDLDVRLNSLDSLYLSVYGTGKYVADLKPNEVEGVPFQVSATATTRVYASVSGTEDGEHFHRESPTIEVKVGKDVAELTTLFVMTEPYPPLEETLKCEATMEGLEKSEGLNVEFWVEKPSGRFDECAKIETKKLSPGEEVKYSAEMTPREEGLYTVHAYLYDGAKRVGHKTDTVFVQK